MTPLEKAKQLVDKYWESSEIGFASSKNCAKILCEEMQELLPDINLIPPVKRLPDANYRQYWFSVEACINKL